MAKITLAQLTAANACAEALAHFQATVGAEVEITEALAVEQAARWDWDWAARHLLSAQHERVYQEAKAPYERAYEEARAQHERVYREAKAQIFARLYILQVHSTSWSAGPSSVGPTS